MTRSISLPVHQKDEFLKFSGALRRRLELEEVKVEPRQIHIGLTFNPSQLEFKQLPDNVFQGEIIWQIDRKITPEQTASLKFLEEAVKENGFEIELEKGGVSIPKEEILNLQLEPPTNLKELLRASFQDRKALPPVSTEFEPFPETFGPKSRKEKVKVVKEKRGND